MFKNSILILIIFSFLIDWMRKSGLILPRGFAHVLLITVFVFNWVLYGKKIYLPKIYLCIITITILYLFIGFCFYDGPVSLYLLGSLLTYIFVIVFSLAANIRSDINHIIYILKGALLFILLTSLVSAINGLISESSISLAPVIFFRELGAMGTAANVGVVIGLALYIRLKEKYYLFAAVILSFIIILASIKKSIIANLVIWTLLLIKEYRGLKKIRLAIIMLIVLAIGLQFSGNYLIENIKLYLNIYKSGKSEILVRPPLYIASGKIAMDYFPFGSGPGTFASIPSLIKGYSDLYYKYNLAYLWAFDQKTLYDEGLSYYYDAFWAHIIAELGIIGSSLYLFVWFFPSISTALLIGKRRHSLYKGIDYYVIAITIIMTIEGIATYSPEIVSFIIMHSGIVGLLYLQISRPNAETKTAN